MEFQVYIPVTAGAKCYQIFESVVSLSTSRLDVMNLEILRRSAALAPPTVPLQNLFAKFVVGLVIQSKARSLWCAQESKASKRFSFAAWGTGQQWPVPAAAPNALANRGRLQHQRDRLTRSHEVSFDLRMRDRERPIILQLLLQAMEPRCRSIQAHFQTARKYSASRSRGGTPELVRPLALWRS